MTIIDIKYEFFTFLDTNTAVITKPINAIEDKLKGNNKDKSAPVKSPLEVEEIAVNPKIENLKQPESPTWDLSQYKESANIENVQKQSTKVETKTQSNDNQSIDDEINI